MWPRFLPALFVLLSAVPSPGPGKGGSAGPEPRAATTAQAGADPSRGSAEKRYAQWKEDVATALNPSNQRQRRQFARSETTPWTLVRALVGLVVLVFLAWLLSVDRKSIRWRPVFYGLLLQAAFALVILNPVVGHVAFEGINQGVGKLLSFAEAGTAFALQGIEPHLATHMEAGHWVVHDVMAGRVSPAVKTLAFWVLPTIIFFSALLALLYHIGLMQRIVQWVARLMQFFMKTSGAETLSCAANVFVGQTEAPLLVRPFIAQMTTSELAAVMTGGFATVAGGVLAVYVAMLHDIPGIAGHLVTASLMAAPGALAIAKIVVPETGQPVTAGTVRVEVERPDANSVEAVARGASDGMQLVLNVAAMLIAFVAMVALADALLGFVGHLFHVQLSLAKLLGWALSPLAWLMGASWKEASTVGHLLGEKLVLTELIAYADLSHLQGELSQRTAILTSYALCGFANVASIGIQIGGIGGIAPTRRSDLARLGLRTMLAGAIVSCISATLAGLIYTLNNGMG